MTEQRQTATIDIPQVIDSLAYMQEYLPRLAGGLAAVAADLQAGRESRAFTAFTTAIDALGSLTDLLQVAVALLGGHAGAAAGIVRAQSVTEALNEQLRAMMDAAQRRDYLALADQCEYELAPFLTDQLTPLLADLAHLIEEIPAA